MGDVKKTGASGDMAEVSHASKSAADLDGNPYPMTRADVFAGALSVPLDVLYGGAGRPWPPPVTPEEGAWPVSFAPDIQVTDEMRIAGAVAANEVCLSLFMAKWNSSDAVQIACAAYRAMHAVAPVPLVTEAEDKIAALTDRLDRANKLTTDMLELLEVKDARIAALDSELARRPAAFVDPDPPKPERTPFREFRHDPRRMGPL